MNDQVTKFIAKVAEFGNLGEAEKQVFIAKLNEGFLKRIIVAGQPIVKKDTLNSLMGNPSEVNIRNFVLEMSKDDEGKNLIGKIIVDFVKFVLEPILPKLSKSQRREIFTIFK